MFIVVTFRTFHCQINESLDIASVDQSIIDHLWLSRYTADWSLGGVPGSVAKVRTADRFEGALRESAEGADSGKRQAERPKKKKSR